MAADELPLPATAPRELERERDLYAALLDSLDLAERAELVLVELLREPALAGAMLNLLDAAEENLTCAAIRLPPKFRDVELTYRGFNFPIASADANVRVLDCGEALHLNAATVGDYPGTTRTRFERWELTDLTILPLAGRSGGFGTLMLLSQSGPIPALALEQVQRTLPRLAPSLEQARQVHRLRALEQELEREAAARERFLRFVTDVNALGDEQAIYQRIASEFMHWFPFDCSVLFLHEDARVRVKHVQPASAAEEPMAQALQAHLRAHPYELDVAAGATPTVLLQNICLVFPDVRLVLHLPMSEVDRRALEIMGDTHTLLLVPIRQGGQAIGVLWLFSLREVVQVSEADKAFIEQLCGFIGSAIHNARLYSVVEQQRREIGALNAQLEQRVQVLHEAAATDRLTGLGNYGTFREALARRLDEFRRVPDEAPPGLVLIDLDHFKRFNDTYGHPAGNALLETVAEVMRGATRRMDTPCRYGGDEFAVIMPRAGREGTRVSAERICAALAEALCLAEYPDVTVTASVGCAVAHPDDTPESLLQAADEALYAAKGAGRGRAVCSER